MAPQSLRPLAASTPRYCGCRQASPTQHMFAPRHTSTCARFVKLPAAATVTVKTLEKRRSVTIRGASDDSLRPASQAVDPCPPDPAPRGLDRGLHRARRARAEITLRYAR